MLFQNHFTLSLSLSLSLPLSLCTPVWSPTEEPFPIPLRPCPGRASCFSVSFSPPLP